MMKKLGSFIIIWLLADISIVYAAVLSVREDLAVYAGQLLAISLLMLIVILCVFVVVFNLIDLLWFLIANRKKIRSRIEKRAYEKMVRNFPIAAYLIIEQAVKEKQDTATIAMNNCHKDLFLGITILLAANHLYSLKEKP